MDESICIRFKSIELFIIWAEEQHMKSDFYNPDPNNVTWICLDWSRAVGFIQPDFVIFCLFIYSSLFQFIYLGLRFYLFIYSCLFVYVLVCLCIFIYLFSLVCLFIYVLYKPWTTKICQIVCSVNSKKIWICLNESMCFLGFWLHPVVCVLSDKKQQQKHEIWC